MDWKQILSIFLFGPSCMDTNEWKNFDENNIPNRVVLYEKNGRLSIGQSNDFDRYKELPYPQELNYEWEDIEEFNYPSTPCFLGCYVNDEWVVSIGYYNVHHILVVLSGSVEEFTHYIEIDSGYSCFDPDKFRVSKMKIEKYLKRLYFNPSVKLVEYCKTKLN